MTAQALRSSVVHRLSYATMIPTAGYFLNSCYTRRMVTQYREDTLRQALQKLAELMPDITASVIVNVDGLVVASYPVNADDVHDPIGDQSVAATTALIMGLAERTLERLAQGAVQRVMIEGVQ